MFANQSDGRPAFLIAGGINGAGKSTVVDQAKRIFPYAIVLNPDKVAAEAIAADPSVSQEAAQYRGLRTTLEAIEQAFERRDNIISETVFANRTYLRLMRRAKSIGYSVHLLFVGLRSVEESIQRVAFRVSKGGHNVPEADIRRRWPLTHANLAVAIEMADSVDVYANFIDGAEPRLVASARDGMATIHDPDALPAVTAALRGQPIP